MIPSTPLPAGVAPLRCTITSLPLWPSFHAKLWWFSTTASDTISPPILAKRLARPLMRMKPRSNDAVNQFYLCDEGRLNYRWLNRADRLSAPQIKLHDVLSPVDWEIAYGEAAKLLALIDGRA